MDQLQRTRATPSPNPKGRGPGGRHRRSHRIRKIVLLVLLVAMIPVGWSYANALTAPGSAPVTTRTVEWIKGHGGGGLVVWAEKVWYSWHKPPVGGTPSGGIPVETGGSSPSAAPAKHVPPHLSAPPDITPIASGTLTNEGHWQTVGRLVDGIPTVRVAYLRPDPVHTSLLAGVMWMDTTLLRPVLIAGAQNPGGAPWPYDAHIPASLYPAIATSFNSGFAIQDAGGGYYAQGRMASPLASGQASFVIYKDGSVNIGTWGQDVKMTPQVAAVRQNLWIMVRDGRPVPQLASDPNVTWGATFGGGVLVWRSGVGITNDGALVYAAGPGLSITSLANILVHAGAVRAMELDINTVWTNGYFYSTDGNSPNGFAPHPLLADQYRGPTRYLIPDERDFFLMYLRSKYLHQ